jgi:glycosyltransferase involved in cell wall biosynthesis
VNAPPTVSVVIATYNRSRVLRQALRSVVESTFTDWEVIVVGDACTDDTAACVESFADPRIRFVNLPVNCGDQSGPNNHGVSLARGRYVAFLNHDDLYLPDHLANCVAALDEGGADLVWVPCAVANVREDAEAGAAPCTFTLEGVPATHGYSPFAFYSASSWMFRRELAQRVGPWPRADRQFVTTSQAWLFRAWRAGAALRFLPKAGVVVVWSGKRAGSYASRESPEHDALVRWLKTDPHARERILEDAAVSAAMRRETMLHHAPWKSAARAILHPLYALLMRAGVHPLSLHMALRYGRRGAYIRWHRRYTGIEA